MTEVYRDSILRERYDDTTRTVTTYDETGALASTRPYTAEEDAQADAALADAARLDSIEDRLARLEAHLWPPTAPDAPVPTTVPTMASYGGVWPAGGLLADAGKVWRNVTTVPLTTPPSGFPGTPAQWAHLFVEHGATTTPPDQWPAWKPWDGNNANLYAAEAQVTHNGRRWTASIGNNHWEPGVYGWDDSGPA